MVPPACFSSIVAEPIHGKASIDERPEQPFNLLADCIA
jgi:hypothetical protein